MLRGGEQKVQILLRGEIKCMRAKINCEEKNQGLRRRGTRAQEESKKFKGESKGAENA